MVVDFSNTQPQLVASNSCAFPDSLRTDIQTLTQPGNDEIDLLGKTDRRLGELYAERVFRLLKDNQLKPTDIRAIGCHGQTIRHRPPSGDVQPAFSLQIGDPNTLVELSGITTVADFRRRDIAAGGEAAPLVPAFHDFVFRTPQKNRVLINLGGIANITVLPATGRTSGFDTGPANVLMNQWINRHLSKAYDDNGEWARSGSVNSGLLKHLLLHPYFNLHPPKSTGREDFHIAWLDRVLKPLTAIAPVDVQATLLEFTCQSLCEAIAQNPQPNLEVFLCGGGSQNKFLVERLSEMLAPSPVQNTAVLGVDSQWVEAMAFAWLAWRRLEHKSGNLPTVTGADGERILGAMYSP